MNNNKELNGWLNIDKPINYSSAKVVAIIKRLTNTKKVGHGGTLDPLATGVLPICLNSATKTTEKMMAFDKEYLFNITFGESRTTNDAEGEIIETNDKIPSKQEIIEILPKFIGNIKQVPPIFSAIKIKGQRAYDLARAGKNIEMQSRDVIVHKFEFLDFISQNTAQFYIKCGKGFYIRSVGIDVAKSLNTVAYISYLRRLSVGIFNQSNILSIEEIQELVEKNLLQDYLIQI